MAPSYETFPSFGSAAQFRRAIELTASLLGISMRKLAQRMGVSHIALSYWLSQTRHPSEQRWHDLMRVVVTWLTVRPGSEAAAKRLASAFVLGPFFVATPAVWGAVLGVGPSLFAASPTDKRGFVTGVDAGHALLTALRARLPVPLGHPEHRRLRDWLAIDQLHRQLAGQVALAHTTAVMLQQIEADLNKLRKKDPKAVARAMAHTEQLAKRRRRGK